MITLDRRAFLITAGLASAGLSAAALTGCGRGSAAPESGRSVQLGFSWWGNDLRRTTFQRVIDDYQAQHPDVGIVGESSDFDPYWDRLATRLAAGDEPDVISMDYAYFREYAERGALLDLSAHGAEIDQFPASLLDTGRVDGKLLGLAHGLSAMALLINPVIFDAAGVDVPDDKAGWSWDDLFALSRELKQQGKELDSGLGGRVFLQAGGFTVFLAQRGKTPFTPEGTIGFTTADLEDWWQLMAQARSAGAVVGPDGMVEEAALDVDQSGLAGGTVAIDCWWSNQLAAMNSAADTELSLLRLPTEDGRPGAGTVYQPTVYWTASARSKQPDAAVDFINYFASSVEAGKLIMTDRGLPANADVRTAISADMSAADRQVIDFLGLDGAGDAAATTPFPPPAGADFGDVYQRHTTEVLFGRQTGAAAARRAIEEITASIN